MAFLKSIVLVAALVAAVCAAPSRHVMTFEEFDNDDADLHRRHNAERELQASIFGHERPTEAERAEHLQHMTCPTCKAIVQTLESLVAAPQAPATEYLINATCAAKFPTDPKGAKLCSGLGDVMVKWLQRYFHHGRFNGWDVPVTICSNIFMVCTTPCCNTTTPHTPEQRWLSFASRQVVAPSTAIRATWVTYLPTPGGAVQWRVGNATQWTTAAEETRTYTEGGWRGVIHSAVMTALPAGATVEYRVGSPLAWSTVLALSTLPLNAGSADRPLNVVMYGDMGYGPNSNGNIEVLKRRVADGEIDFIVHQGDISYADSDEHHWDVYGRKMEEITSRVPYMTAPGNHEQYWNYSAYRARMWMPAAGDGAPSGAMYYRFDAGPFAFLSMNAQDDWLLAGLGGDAAKWADKQLTDTDARGSFAVAAFHQPLYCSSGGHSCARDSLERRRKIEHVFDRHRDSLKVVMVGHLHNYERMLPIGRNGTVVEKSYDHPSYPTYIVSGAAGCREGFAGFLPTKPAFSVVRLQEWGFSRLVLARDSAATTAAVTYELGNGTVADAFKIVTHA